MSQEAFIGVLACAREADGAFPASERDLLNLICLNHMFTRDLAPDRYSAMVLSIKSHIASVGWNKAMIQYLAELPTNWGYTTLLSTIDVCLIDAQEDKNELACIDAVARRFLIPKEHVDNFLHWFRIKNGMPSDVGLNTSEERATGTTAP